MKTRNIILSGIFFAIAMVAITACDENGNNCPDGQEGCPCVQAKTCDDGLTCDVKADVCDKDTGGGDGDTDTDSDTDSDSDADGDGDPLDPEAQARCEAHAAKWQDEWVAEDNPEHAGCLVTAVFINDAENHNVCQNKYASINEELYCGYHGTMFGDTDKICDEYNNCTELNENDKLVFLPTDAPPRPYIRYRP